MARSSAAIRGFTLIELMLATVILLLLMSTAAYSYQLFAQHWQRRLSDIDSSFEHLKYMDLVRESVQGISTYLVRDEDGSYGYYFLGKDEGFTAVTSSPVFQTGYPAVFRLFREQNESGTFRLVYEEASLQGNLLVNASQQLDFTYRLTVMDDLPAISFSYYAIDVTAETDFDAAVQKRWFVQFDGLQTRRQPEQLKIQLGDFIWPVALENRMREYSSRFQSDT